MAHNYATIKTSLIILLLTRSVQSIKSREVAVDFLKLGDIVNALSALGLRWLAVQLVSILVIATSFFLWVQTSAVILMLESEVLILVMLVHAALLRDVHGAISSSSHVVVEADRDTARRLYTGCWMLHDELIRRHVVGEASVACKDVVPEDIATTVILVQ